MSNQPEPGGPPGQDEHDGKGKPFDVAVENAWNEAKGKAQGPGWYEVKKVWVRTENPIREYKVRIKG